MRTGWNENVYAEYCGGEVGDEWGKFGRNGGNRDKIMLPCSTVVGVTGGCAVSLLGRDERRYFTPGQSSAGTSDCLRTGKSSPHVTSHLAQLSLPRIRGM